MGIELSKGDIFITMDGKTTKFGSGIPFTEEIEFSAEENPPYLYHFNQPSVSFEISGANLSLMNNFCNMPTLNGKFTIEADRKIMIQARWHKKARIRKKWLKRFGMKPDTVKMKMNAANGEYHTDDGSFEFKTDMPEYLWRPDQNRKDLKIEY